MIPHPPFGERVPNHAVPAVHPDQSITAVLLSAVDEQGYLRVQVPAGLIQPQDGVAGRYVLARCGAGGAAARGEAWSLYARRPLFVCGYARSEVTDIWRLHVPGDDDAGHGWLRSLPEESALNLIGPLGIGFRIHPATRNLLLLASWESIAPLLPLIDPILAAGGRVTLIVHTPQPLSPVQRNSLPLAVEIRSVATTGDLMAALAQTIRWADQIAVTLPAPLYPPIMQSVREHRFHVEADFVQALVEADLLCGVGACLACVIALPHGGITRACIHGPVFDLAQVA